METFSDARIIAVGGGKVGQDMTKDLFQGSIMEVLLSGITQRTISVFSLAKAVHWDPCVGFLKSLNPHWFTDCQ